MNKVLLLLAISLFGLTEAIGNPELKPCYDNLIKYNITPKLFNYSQLVEIGDVYGNEVCDIYTNNRKPFSAFTCDQLTFLPKTNSCGPALINLTIALNFTFVTTYALFEMYDTSIPGVYELYEQMTYSNARLLVVFEARPGTLIRYICSVDPWKHNDFRIYTAEQFPDKANIEAELATLSDDSLSSLPYYTKQLPIGNCTTHSPKRSNTGRSH